MSEWILGELEKKDKNATDDEKNKPFDLKLDTWLEGRPGLRDVINSEQLQELLVGKSAPGKLLSRLFAACLPPDIPREGLTYYNALLDRNKEPVRVIGIKSEQFNNALLAMVANATTPHEALFIMLDVYYGSIATIAMKLGIGDGYILRWREGIASNHLNEGKDGKYPELKSAIEEIFGTELAQAFEQPMQKHRERFKKLIPQVEKRRYSP